MAADCGLSYERDASLVMDFQKGDKEAFSQLMGIHLSWVYGLCRRVTGDEAEDVCQEVFLQAYRNLPNLRQPITFMAWLRKLAWHHCQRKGSKTRLQDAITDSTASSDPWNTLVDGIELGQAFDLLSMRHRQVVILSLIYGYGEREISKILDIPHGTVKSRLHKARKALQGYLSQTEGDMDLDTRKRIMGEVDKRIQSFHDNVVKPNDIDPAPAEENARKWHILRQEDAENNARIYGIELMDTGPRMTKEKIMSGTLSRVGITRQVMGIPENAEYMDYRDASRRLLVSPFTLQAWERQGMPTVRYYPWKWLDLGLIKGWLADNNIEPPMEVTIDEMDLMERFILIEVQAGRANIEDSLELLNSM